MSNDKDQAFNEDDWVNTYKPIDFTDPTTPHNRVLIVEGQQFFVYADHLSLYSEFFRTMFNSDFKEKNEEEIEIKEVEAQEFHDFLMLLTPNSVNVVNANNFQLLVSYSHRFLAREVFAICEQFVLANFDNLEKIELLKMAFDYNWIKLKEKLHVLLNASSTCNKTKNCSPSDLFYCHGCKTNVTIKSALTKSSFLVTNKDAIAKLPVEIQIWLFNELLNKTANM